MGNLLQFRKSELTKPEHDTMRQISRSEMPSIDFWHHHCRIKVSNVTDEVTMKKGYACPFCHKTEDDFKKPSLHETLKHIARAQQPKSIIWDHLCPCAGMVNTKLPDGHICPDCYVDQYGDYHGRPDGAV